MFPGVLSNHRDLFDVTTMLGGKLDVFPDCALIPTVKVVHDEKNLDLVRAVDQVDDGRFKCLVVGGGHTESEANNEAEASGGTSTGECPAA